MQIWLSISKILFESKSYFWSLENNCILSMFFRISRTFTFLPKLGILFMQDDLGEDTDIEKGHTNKFTGRTNRFFQHCHTQRKSFDCTHAWTVCSITSESSDALFVNSNKLSQKTNGYIMEHNIRLSQIKCQQYKVSRERRSLTSPLFAASPAGTLINTLPVCMSENAQNWNIIKDNEINKKWHNENTYQKLIYQSLTGSFSQF